MNRRAQMAALASVDDQIAGWGEDRWIRDFDRLTEIHVNGDRETLRLREQVWRTLPHSRFKLFQQLFCSPKHWIVPACNTQGNSVRFQTRTDLNEGSLDPCLVSPDRIPDVLALQLGLVHYDDEDRRRPLLRLRKKKDAIPPLKRVWEVAGPLEEKHWRLLLVRDPGLVTTGPPLLKPDAPGSILYTREHAAREGEKEVQYFDGLYSAHRKTEHERKVYEGEISDLAQIEVKLRELNGTLDREWKRDTPSERKDQLRVHARTILVECADALKTCVNRHKVAAADIVATTTSLTVTRADVGEVTNVSACMAKMVRALNQLKVRFQEMCGKGSYNERDGMVLHRLIERGERTFERFRERVTDTCQSLERRLERTRLFSTLPLTEAQLHAERQGFQVHLLRDIGHEEITSLSCRPFVTYGQSILQILDTLPQVTASRNAGQLRDLLVKVHIVGKLQEIHRCFEQIKACAIDADRVHLGDIRTFVSSVRAVMATRQIFPGHTVAAYEEPFRQVLAVITSVESGLRHYEQQDLEVSARAEICRNLKLYLEQCDCEAFVRNLTSTE